MWRGKQAAPSFLDPDPQHSWSSLCRKVDSSCSLTTCQSLVHKFTHRHCALLSDLGVEEVEGMGVMMKWTGGEGATDYGVSSLQGIRALNPSSDAAVLENSCVLPAWYSACWYSTPLRADTRMNRQQGDEEEFTEKSQHKKNGGQVPCGCQIFLIKV